MMAVRKRQNIGCISIVGLGKMGLCMAACFAQKYKVEAVDVDRNKIELIRQGKNPVQEPGLTEALNNYRKNLCVSSDYQKAVVNSQVTFIVVATPSEVDGSFSNGQLEESLQNIGLALREKDEYHLVVITSTVMPGTTDHIGKAILEKTSGKICGKDFGLAYNPEFIALGSVIHDFLNPDFTLIGEANKQDGEILENIYRNICENSPRFARMNPVNAEIAKISLNCYVTMKITFANSLAAICERVSGADAEIITRAIGLDSRIGGKYLKPGLGFGGPCFPRDNVAFATFARGVNVEAKLAGIVDEVNREQGKRIVNIVEELGAKIKKTKERIVIGVLGLSYKPNTPIIEDSQAIDIVRSLIDKGYKVIVYDPQALELAKNVFGDGVIHAKNGVECVKEADVVLVATPWDEFKSIDMTGTKKDLCILDCWGIIKDRGLGVPIKYIGKGVGV